MVNSKNPYYETFLANFWLVLKKVSCDFYWFWLALFLKTLIIHKISRLLWKDFYIFSPSIRMSGKNINFDDKKINKSNFNRNKKLFNIFDIVVNQILVSKKELYGRENSFKFFIGYNENNYIRPLCIKLHQMIGYVKCFDSNKTMSFKVNDNRLLKK